MNNADKLSYILIGIGIILVLMISVFVGVGIFEEAQKVNLDISNACHRLGLEQKKDTYVCEGINSRGEYISKELVLFNEKYIPKES